MAPQAKPKLSQTRLTTPQKPAPKISFSTTKTAGSRSKTKVKPNHSILSFFKKAPAPDEGLFIGEDGREGDQKEDLNGTNLSSATCDVNEATRYNELGGAVKKRRLSPPLRVVKTEAEGGDSVSATGSTESLGATTAVSRPDLNTPAAPKRKVGNPFLDDSSDDDDDDDDDDDKENSPMVRPPPPVSAESNHEEYEGPEPAKLTKEEEVSRRAPLLRQKTSGEDLKSDDKMCGEPDDSDPNKAEATLIEDDGFTCEELEAMIYMEEQARREAEEEGEGQEQSEYTSDETMTECCPVCNGSLAGTTSDEATAHVNSCLDGKPTPLPKPAVQVCETTHETEGPAAGKRFAKAAVARPGQANPITFSNNAEDPKSNSAFTKLMSGHAEDAAWAAAAAAETASRGMPAYKRTCPFYKIMPGFFICVDAFRYGAVEGCKAYFLSHFHSDHYMGLTANWTHGPIYCSKVTGSLVKSQLKTAARYVVELEFEETVLVPDTGGVTVTMIPANHCPGSSLFLFEKSAAGRTQRILHCGDFRACPAHVEHPKLRPETVDAVSGRTKQQKIDVCYLDTTYLNPRYSFPPQDDVITACAELCALLNKALLANDDREWEALLRRQRAGSSSDAKDVSKFFTTAAADAAAAAASSSATSTSSATPRPDQNAFTALDGRLRHPNRLLVVCGTYSIGKERICVAIARALRTKIYASPAKILMCKQLGDPELSSLLTSDPVEAQVHMQMLMEIRAETLAEYLEGYKVRGEFGRIIGFRPSGWNYRPSTGKPGNGGSATIGANLPPTSLPTTELLHGPGWKTRFALKDLVPQRGSSREVLCFGVPYSEHSSFRELAMFVMALRIERIVPTVNVGSEASRRRMRGWLDRWLSERRRGGLVRVLPSGEEEGGKGRGNAAELWEGKDGRGGGVYW
ncbi:DRMBL-domain-containing protein [Thermothelomyces heterothallicus CBS 203.75]